MTSDDVIAQQVVMYGEPLSARFSRLLAAFGIPQSRLAATIGLSAPMLSQLASGQRAKISNPAVLARLLTLEHLLDSPVVRSGDVVRMRQALDEVAASHPTLTTEVGFADPDSAATVRLAGIAPIDDLERAAAAVPGTALAALLHSAAALHRHSAAARRAERER